MARIGDGGDLLKCSFCGKSQKQVKKLIAGPGVYICDECIDLCNEIIEEELADADEYEVRVYDVERGRRLVAAVEIVSPANKDRPESRAQFVAKCAALLRQRCCWRAAVCWR